MLTTNPDDARLGHGVDTEKTPQHDVYLVLSEEERAKGFARPYRDRYIHTGERPTYPLQDLTKKQQELYGDVGYVKFEKYPKKKDSSAIGRYWTQAQLDSGCGSETTMGQALSETYAREPRFYGSTYCVNCQKHLPVAEFVWTIDNETVGS